MCNEFHKDFYTELTIAAFSRMRTGASHTKYVYGMGTRFLCIV